MQPQGHFSLMLNMYQDFLDPQASVDSPRFCIADGTRDGKVYFEEGTPQSVVDELVAMGHDVGNGGKVVKGFERCLFGKAQIVRRNAHGGLEGGSDPRADGCAMGVF